MLDYGWDDKLQQQTKPADKPFFHFLSPFPKHAEVLVLLLMHTAPYDTKTESIVRMGAGDNHQPCHNCVYFSRGHYMQDRKE